MRERLRKITGPLIAILALAAPRAQAGDHPPAHPLLDARRFHFNMGLWPYTGHYPYEHGYGRPVKSHVHKRNRPAVMIVPAPAPIPSRPALPPHAR